MIEIVDPARLDAANQRSAAVRLDLFNASLAIRAMTAVIVVMVVVVAVVATTIVPIIPALVTAVAAVAMPFLVARDVFVLIPVVLHKVDPLVAGVVLVAMSAPVLRVAWRYVQVDGRAVHRCPIDDARLLVDHLRPRKVTDVDVTIEARLANAERYPDIGGKRRCGDGRECCRK